MMLNILMTGALFLMFGSGKCSVEEISVATFDVLESGVSGIIAVRDGSVFVDLDFSKLTNYHLPNGETINSCLLGGLGLPYHIHEFWADNLQNVGSSNMCSSANTGGHWDPWAACGPATGNSDCSHLNGCIERGFNTPLGYNCNLQNHLSNPITSCEVGDWSGKYGRLTVDSKTFETSAVSLKSVNLLSDKLFLQRYEVKTSDLIDRSVVLHCNGGARFACARFEKQTVEFNEPLLTVPVAVAPKNNQKPKNNKNKNNKNKNKNDPILILPTTTVSASFGGNNAPLIVVENDNILGESRKGFFRKFCGKNGIIKTFVMAKSWRYESGAVLRGNACSDVNLGYILDTGISCVEGSEFEDTVCYGLDQKCMNKYSYFDMMFRSPFYRALGDISYVFDYENVRNDYLQLPSKYDYINKPVVIQCQETQQRICTNFVEN